LPAQGCPVEPVTARREADDMRYATAQEKQRVWRRIDVNTKIITREGHAALKQELDHLWRVYRPEITQKVAWAASLGDRSENADYQYNKKLLREIDRRVRYLRKRLEDMRVVDYSPEQEGRVYFGAWVEIENEAGELKTFRVVGYDEIYGRMDYISIDSPMARALLKKEVGDEFVVQIPTGEALWWINEISYPK
jgi:transcription elongation factor GreB